MTKRMLIDASHPEETRVVVLNDRQLDEFDFESTTKKQLKGNIYLAKVTRVEPSLQAAFVDYGGQRHGFLAFSEIHPDYYQIPQADRRMLEEASRVEQAQAEAAPIESGNGAADAEAAEAEAVATDPDEETAEVIDEQARRRSQLLRSYKIQEVIKRRQILLVQVVKEERGTKGAALTTYLSLAGRYCVLMPNTARGGGISRKISSPGDRSRLKEIARELKVPQGMGLIIRTAGQERNRQEIRRDYEYLLRLWSDIRDLTLKSIAPCTIHEEGALIQRAIRDLYTRDIDEVLVEGEEGYRGARRIMSMLMPSRTRRVKLYKEDVPLFHGFEVEESLDAMHSPVVQLRSGGSIVIHTTEALTAIDVNSGRSTRERNIEETALKTNLEAADEVARQLRLRDVAGLVVVDFIDMSESRHQRALERRYRDALRADRARVQMGRLSAFGLLELSRQRLRPSFQELSTQLCPVCKGLGAVRSVESAALQALRAIELDGMKGASAAARIELPLPVALYLLNQKRERLLALEQRYAMTIEVATDEALIAGDYRLERLQSRAEPEAAPVEVEAAPAPASTPAATREPAAAADEEGDAGKRRRRRRRRRRKPQEGEVETETGLAARGNGSAEDMSPEAPRAVAAAPEEVEEPEAAAAEAEAPEEVAEAGAGSEERRPRRRRARRTRETKPAVAAEEGTGDPDAPPAPDAAEESATRTSPPPAAAVAAESARDGDGDADDGDAAAKADVPAAAEEPRPEGPERRDESVPAGVVDKRGGGGPSRRGWWSRFVRKDE